MASSSWPVFNVPISLHVSIFFKNSVDTYLLAMDVLPPLSYQRHLKFLLPPLRFGYPQGFDHHAHNSLHVISLHIQVFT